MLAYTSVSVTHDNSVIILKNLHIHIITVILQMNNIIITSYWFSGQEQGQRICFKEYAYSPDLPERVVKGDWRWGRGSLLGPEAKNRTAIVFLAHTRFLNSQQPPPSYRWWHIYYEINICEINSISVTGNHLNSTSFQLRSIKKHSSTCMKITK